jgi:catalase
MRFPSALARVALVSSALLGFSLPVARAEDVSTEEQIVAIMNKIWGQHPGTRANHAKGVVLEGVFMPTSAAVELSKAALFKSTNIPVTVRFSDSTGLPNIPDGSPGANPHGMAIKFHLPSGGDVDVVANSLAFFPVSNGEEFRDLLQALLDSPPGSSKPTKADAFFATHPNAPKAFGSVHTPSSFAREIYNGVNSFIFVSAGGARKYFRFKIVPDGGPAYLAAEEAAKLPPDGLVDEIKSRVHAQPVKFMLQAQLAEPGDTVNDGAKPYAPERKSVELGTIILNKSIEEDKQLNYLPLNLTDGIEPSDDPLINVRNNAYAISIGKRLQ